MEIKYKIGSFLKIGKCHGLILTGVRDETCTGGPQRFYTCRQVIFSDPGFREEEPQVRGLDGNLILLNEIEIDALVNYCLEQIARQVKTGKKE